jgi:hypothetical protein
VDSKEIEINKIEEQSLQISFLLRARGLCFIFMLFQLLGFSSLNNASAQDTATKSLDSLSLTTKPKIHSPRKATIFALVLPGLGQAYNHKYWKIPIVYAAFGGCIYFIQTNTKLYNEFKDAYDYVAVTSKTIYPPTPVNIFHPIPDPPNQWVAKYEEENLKTGRDFYRRRLEVSYIATGVCYILSVVDAVVDAHFFDYDIGEDLTLNVKPWVPELGVNQANRVSGVTLSFRF